MATARSLSGSALDAPTADRLLTDYCADPARHWPATAQRQARKLAKHLARSAKALKVPVEHVPQAALASARQRTGARRPTLYLANIGSSGSHWLEDMLVDGASMLGAGEVYLPTPVSRAVDELPREEARVFIDALHLIHADEPAPDETASVINSQHSTQPTAFLNADPSGCRVLLLRDPVDVCLSRTFRKDTYRRDVAPDADNLAYLRDNIRLVKGFLSEARTQEFALVIRYEDLVRDPVPSLTALCHLTATPVERQRLRQVAERRSARQLIASGEAAHTNLFAGDKRAIPASARRLAARELADVSRSFGYAGA